MSATIENHHSELSYEDTTPTDSKPQKPLAHTQSKDSVGSDDVVSSSELSNPKATSTDENCDSFLIEEDTSTTSMSIGSTGNANRRTESVDSDSYSEGRMVMRDNDFTSEQQQHSPSRGGLLSKLKLAFGGSSDGSGQSSMFAKRALKFSMSKTNSGMPPKSAEEEERHRRQIEEMNRSFKKKLMREAKTAQKKREQQTEREEFMTKAATIWKEDIIPNWCQKHNAKQTRSLWKHGLPPRVRGRVWELAIGNDLNITEDLYCIFQSKAMDDRVTRSTVSSPVETFKQIHEAPSSEQSLRESGRNVSREASSKLIQMDLERTFPTLQFFQAEGPLNGALEEVLETYVKYRPDVGYVQGMSYIAAMLLLYSDTYNSFVGLANMLNKYHFLHFFRMETETIEVYMETFQVLLKQHLPSLFKIFADHKISPHFYLVEWFLTLFSKPLPLDIAARIWDLFFLYGEVFLYRAALGILKLYCKRIEAMSFDDCMMFLCHLPTEIDSKQFFDTIFSVKVSHRKFTVAKQQAQQNVQSRRV